MQLVNISISTTQYNEHGEKNVIDVKSIGKMYEKNGNTYIVYKENEEDSEVSTTIKINKDNVMIKRFGDLNSSMHFEEGKTNVSNYMTQQGMFTVEIVTNKLNIAINKNISIHIDYNIDISDMFKGRNVIKIKIN